MYVLEGWMLGCHEVVHNFRGKKQSGHGMTNFGEICELELRDDKHQFGAATQSTLHCWRTPSQFLYAVEPLGLGARQLPGLARAPRAAGAPRRRSGAADARQRSLWEGMRSAIWATTATRPPRCGGRSWESHNADNILFQHEREESVELCLDYSFVIQLALDCRAVTPYGVVRYTHICLFGNVLGRLIGVSHLDQEYHKCRTLGCPVK